MLAGKLASVVANVSTVLGLALYIVERTSGPAMPSGFARLNVVIHLALLCAVGYGILWSLLERMMGWEFGAGGSQSHPSGWSAVALGASLILPLLTIPFFYQLATGTRVLEQAHWRAALAVLPLGVGTHVLIYGTSRHGWRGLRARFFPTRNLPFIRSLVREFTYASLYFLSIALPYRLIVSPQDGILELLLGRTLLPILCYFFGITLFIVLKYPGSLKSSRWIELRGMLAGILLNFCFSGAMFL